MARGDAWQVHNSGSSNWTTGDIFEGPKPTTAGRQGSNEKKQRLAFSHTNAVSTAFGYTNCSIKACCRKKFLCWFLFFFIYLFHFFPLPPSLGCSGTVKTQLGRKHQDEVITANGNRKWRNRPLGQRKTARQLHRSLSKTLQVSRTLLRDCVVAGLENAVKVLLEGSSVDQHWSALPAPSKKRIEGSFSMEFVSSLCGFPSTFLANGSRVDCRI